MWRSFSQNVVWTFPTKASGTGFSSSGNNMPKGLTARRSRPDCRWHLDEVFVTISGKRMYLWRAVDDEGEVLEVLVQSRRNKKAALKLMRKLLKKQGFIPSRHCNRQTCLHTVQHLGISGYPGTMILVAERTTGLKIHISLFDDGNARCNGSSQPVRHNAFSQFIPPSTICSTSSVI